MELHRQTSGSGLTRTWVRKLADGWLHVVAWWTRLWTKPGLSAAEESRLRDDGAVLLPPPPDAEKVPSKTQLRRFEEERWTLGQVRPSQVKGVRRQIAPQFEAAFAKPLSGRQWRKLRKQIRQRDRQKAAAMNP